MISWQWWDCFVRLGFQLIVALRNGMSWLQWGTLSTHQYLTWPMSETFSFWWFGGCGSSDQVDLFLQSLAKLGTVSKFDGGKAGMFNWALVKPHGWFLLRGWATILSSCTKGIPKGCDWIKPLIEGLVGNPKGLCAGSSKLQVVWYINNV